MGTQFPAPCISFHFLASRWPWQCCCWPPAGDRAVASWSRVGAGLPPLSGGCRGLGLHLPLQGLRQPVPSTPPRARALGGCPPAPSLPVDWHVPLGRPRVPPQQAPLAALPCFWKVSFSGGIGVLGRRQPRQVTARAGELSRRCQGLPRITPSSGLAALPSTPAACGPSFPPSRGLSGLHLDRSRLPGALWRWA